MARITGGDMLIGYKTASTFGTAVQIGAGDGFSFDSLNHSTNPSELSSAPKGAGIAMLRDAIQGADAPSITVDAKPTYANGLTAAMADFFGTASSPSEQNVGEGDYLHRFTYNKTRQFGTLAFESSTTTVIEYTSAYPTGLRMVGGDVPNYLQTTIDFVSGSRDLSTSTNTNANMASATITDAEEVAIDHDDDFWINAEGGGALASGDQLDILSFDLNLTRPMNHTQEINGAAGLSAPETSGLFAGTLTVTLRGLTDHTYFTAADAGTKYKAKINIEGSQIASGDNRTMAMYMPRLVLIQDPQYNITEDGINPHVLTFMVLAAESTPTGMNDKYPYMELTNTVSSQY